MEQSVHAETGAPAVAEVDDLFRYGWRYVRCTQPDGTEVVDQSPLTLEDVLYPEEGDFVVQEPVHLRDFFYCHSVLEGYYASQPGVVVLGDCRIDWGVSGVRPMGPDIVVLFDVQQWRQRATFYRAEEGGEPVLVLEVVSPSTRVHDLGAKLNLYHRVGVRKYVLIDRGPRNEAPVRILGYQHSPGGWLPLLPDAHGWLDLAPVGMLLGIDEDRPWLYDTVTGRRLPDRRELQHALTDAETRAQDAETQAQAEAQARARLEEQRYTEAQARAALEERLRGLEAQLRQPRDTAS